MPIIPRANPADVTQIDLAPNVRNTAEVRPTQGIAEVGQQFAGMARKWAEQVADRNDTSAVMAARRQLSDWEASTFDPANPEGISKYQGQNALGANEAILPDLDKRVSQISSTLTPRQQQAFGQVAFQFRDSVQGRLTQHMTQQHEAFLQASDKATQDGLLNDAVSAAAQGDYTIGQQRLDEGRTAMRLSLDHRGMPENVIAQADRDYVSSYHAAITDSLLQTDPAKAQDYYNDHHDQLSVDDRLKIERVLRPVATEANARSLVDGWVAGTTTPAAGLPVEGAAKTPAEVDAIARASVERTVGLESGGNADARNPASSATGAAQFIDATWLDVVTRNRPDLTAGKTRAQVLALRSDPALSKEMATAYAIENCRGLYESGLPVTPETAYLCHHFGLQGARNILRANPSAPIASVIAPAQYAANSYLKGKTVAEVLGNHAERAGGTLDPAYGARPSAALVDGKPDFTTLTQRASALPNPLLRDAALRDIEQRRALQERAERDHNESMATSLNDTVEAVPPGTAYEKAFTPDQQAYARDHGLVDNLQARLKARATGTLVQSNPVLLDAYLRESVTDPATFATRKTDILAHAHELSTADLATLIGRVDALNDPKKAGKAADWATEQQRINGGLRTLGMDPSSKSAKDKEKAALFGMAYRQAKEAYIQQNKFEPTGEKADILLRNVVRTFAENERAGVGHAGVQAFANFAAGQPMKDSAGKPVQLSEGDRAAATALLRQRLGREPTEAEIIAKVGAYYARGGR